MNILDRIAHLGTLEQKAVVHGGENLPAHLDGKLMPNYDWSFEDAVALGYKQSPLAYIGTSALADAASTVEWVASVKDGEDWSPEPGHPMSMLLGAPNKNTSGAEMMQMFILHAYLGGNGLIRKNLMPSKPLLPGATEQQIGEMWNLIPSGVSPIPSRLNFLKGYTVEREGKKPKFYPAARIAHFMLPDPENPYWGMSPFQPLAKVVDTEKESLTWNLSSMSRRAVGDGVFASKQSMTPQQWNEYRKMVQVQHQGADNAHGPWVLGGDFTYQEMSRSPVEMDFIRSLGALREMVLSGLHIPPVVAGFFDDATLANAEVSRRLFWIDVVVPMLNRIRQVFNRSIVPHFGNKESLRITYSLAKIEALRDDTKLQADTFYQLQRAGVPYKESADIVGLNLKPQDEDDVPYGIMTAPGGAKQTDGGSGDDTGDSTERPAATQKITSFGAAARLSK